MVEFCVRLAEVNISVKALFESTKSYCRDYLVDEKNADVSLAIAEGDILAERIKAQHEYALEGISAPLPSDAYLETLALYRKIADAIIEYDVLLFHGSAIAVDGEAYIFTAKSGTGKSTHTRLWREHFGERAVMVNDDKPLIRVKDGVSTVFGTPWCGKHNLGANISAPLKAICILERAAENSIREAQPISEFPKLLSQTYRNGDRDFMQRLVALLDRMIHSASVYRLGCNMDPEAAIVSYNGMRGKNSEA